ncbi:MAG TPA: DUF4845 domain-containing protein [Burkholderiales bacterium]|nr:DUF4845 domain-containing protein [Burkholderiales bacterium]
MKTSRNFSAAARRSQSGLSMVGFIGLAIIVGFAALLALKLVPVYVEYFAVRSILNNLANDREMKDAQIRDIRNIFIRRAQIADVTNVRGSDVDISRDSGVLTLATSYTVRVPVAGHVNLCLDFNVVAQR